MRDPDVSEDITIEQWGGISGYRGLPLDAGGHSRWIGNPKGLVRIELTVHNGVFQSVWAWDTTGTRFAPKNNGDEFRHRILPGTRDG
ncbi:MAG: hypothetical protein KDD43_12825, partial [Bdellovibrionales bacterium]|nr:hypothetical protein [Bdellovibrionales bacterium]